MAPRDFENLDLVSALDQDAKAILEQGNTDLVFGGSSVQEAEVFGRDISANDAPRVGAFLGGVALANLKVQNERSQRFNRIQEIQKRLQDERLANLKSRTGLEQSRISAQSATDVAGIRGEDALARQGAADAQALERVKVQQRNANERTKLTVEGNKKNANASTERERLNQILINKATDRGVPADIVAEAIKVANGNSGLLNSKLNEAKVSNSLVDNNNPLKDIVK